MCEGFNVIQIPDWRLVIFRRLERPLQKHWYSHSLKVSLPKTPSINSFENALALMKTESFPIAVGNQR